MGIRFIFGTAGTGKTTYCINEIKQGLKDLKKMILLVPEQYMFNTENKILDYIGESAFLNVEVLSFRKMARNVFESYGGRTKNIINESGKRMFIHKILNDNMDSLEYFKRISREQGFNDIVSEIITELKKYDVDIEIIKNLREKIEDHELVQKLQEIAVIFEAFEKKMHESYIDVEDEIEILCERLEKCNCYSGYEVWIDEFTTFTPQQLSIIKVLAKRCERVNITLTMNSLIDGNGQDTDVFLPIYNTENNILKIMEKNNIAYEPPVNLNSKTNIPNRFRIFNNNELAHLEFNFAQYKFNEFLHNNEYITLYKANNVYDEIENTAKSIINLIRDKEYRFKDIAVVCRNINDYEKIISVIFDEYNIPYFIDKKLKLKNNPLIIIITAAFEILLKNWSYESVFKYLKSGLIQIKNEYVDLLENFILESGFKGHRWLNNDILSDAAFKSKDSENAALIGDIIDCIREPLINFHNKIKGKHTVKEICTAIYEFLIELNIFSKIDQWIELFEQKGLESKVREYEQVESIVIDTLDQAVNVLGHEVLEPYEFFRILDSGFEKEEIGIVPVSLDQVNIGDVSRIKGINVKALYVVGINDGVFPSVNKDEGIISDRERMLLKNIGVNLASTTREKAFEEEFLIYTALTIPSQYLMLSYPIADFEGKSLRPSIIISKIKKIFPKLKELSFLNVNENLLKNIVSPTPAFNELILAMRKDYDNEKIENYWNEVYKWFLNKEEYRKKIDNIFKGLNYSNLNNKVARNKLIELYKNGNNKLMFSVSRLEQYASCPFSYFIMYGLKAKNRKIYEFTPPDMGTFIHEILDLFTKKVKEEGILWSQLDNKRCKELVTEIIDKKLEEDENSILNSNKKYKYLATRFKRVLSKSVSIISEQMQKGLFEVFKTEFNFGNYRDGEALTLKLDSDEKIYLQGKIDRIDKLDLDENTYIRIVDYKTGAKKFDLNEVYYGLQIQLLVYLDALIKNSKYILKTQAKPGAILYFRVDDPIIKSNKELTTEEVETKVMDTLKLKGLLLKDAKVIKAMDKDIEGYSLVIPAAFKQNGDFTANSSVVTEEEFNLLREYVNKKMKETCEEMLSGEIKIEPSNNNKTPFCEYCDYSSICQFDTKLKDNKYKVILKKSQDNIMEKIKNEMLSSGDEEK